MIDAIPRADASALFTDEEKAVIALSTELTKTARLTAETLDRARRFFDERALVELVVNVGIANMNNRITESFWADPEEE